MKKLLTKEEAIDLMGPDYTYSGDCGDAFIFTDNEYPPDMAANGTIWVMKDNGERVRDFYSIRHIK